MAPPDFEPAPAPTAPSVTVDPKLSLDAPLGDVYFLHATIDKTSAVVGEQVVYSVFEYGDVESGGVEVDEENLHDSQVADFVKRPLLRDDQDAVLVGFASVGGKTWAVKLVRRWALFPLRSGSLTIGPMSVTLVHPRTASGMPSARPRPFTCRWLRLLSPDGRPDTRQATSVTSCCPRRYSRARSRPVARSASMSSSRAAETSRARSPLPRAMASSGSCRRHTRSSDPRPTAPSAESLNLRASSSALKKEGKVDLGDLTLPFWDPEAKRYQVARAPLGAVQVTPSTASAAGQRPEPEQQPLAGLPEPRRTLEGSERQRRPWRRGARDGTLLFWLVVGAWPGAFGVAVGGRALGRRALGARRVRRASPAADLLRKDVLRERRVRQR